MSAPLQRLVSESEPWKKRLLEKEPSEKEPLEKQQSKKCLSRDDIVPCEKEPFDVSPPEENNHDVVPLESIKLDFPGIAKVAAIRNACTAADKRSCGTHDEFYSCLDEWTQRLSEVHQSQLDEACQRIIQELAINVPQYERCESPYNASWLTEALGDGPRESSGPAPQAQNSASLNAPAWRGSKLAFASDQNPPAEGNGDVPHNPFGLQKCSSQVSLPSKSTKGREFAMRDSAVSVESVVVEAKAGTALSTGMGERNTNRTTLTMVDTISRGRAGLKLERKIKLPKKQWWENILPKKTMRKKASARWEDGIEKRMNRFERMVTSKAFDLISAFFIVSFLVTLGIETDHMSQHSGKNSSLNSSVSLGFNIWFTLELILRLAAERSRYFTSEEWMLNITDCFLVMNSVVELVMLALTGGNDKGMANLKVGRIMRIVRLLRVIRIVRLVRALRYFYQFRKMVCLIQGCFMTLFWVLLILSSIVYTFAVFFTQGANDYLFQSDSDSLQDVPQGRVIQKYYGSLALTMKSLFMSMSNGVSWDYTFSPLGSMGWIYSLSFLVFICSSVFGVLNVITSVFVESTMKSALAYRDLIITDNEKSKEVALEHLHDVFVEIDEDGDGVVTVEEMMVFLEDPNIEMYLNALDINSRDARALFLMLDADQSGMVDISEFCDGCLKLKGEAKSFDVHCIMCELSKFFKRWTQFTRHCVTRFDAIEAYIQHATTVSRVQSARGVKVKPKTHKL